MTLHSAGAIAGKRFALEDTGGLVCLDCLRDFIDADRFLGHVEACGAPGASEERPEPSSEVVEPVAEASEPAPRDPEELPVGYKLTGGRGGYYGVRTPDGRTLVGPDNRKFHGKSDAAVAAWADYEENA